jgi:predicted regulator of Ras-like GTPase activity (Roadblock/LC7/MglB family)
MTLRDILSDINAVVGVDGAFVVDESGAVMQSVLPPMADTMELGTVARRLVRANDAMARIGVVVSDLDVVYEHGRMFGRWLSRGALFVLCQPAINLPLLNMTANMAMERLEKGMTEKRQLDAVTTELIVEPNDGLFVRKGVAVLDAGLLEKWAVGEGVRSVDRVFVTLPNGKEERMKATNMKNLGSHVRLASADISRLKLKPLSKVKVRPV